MIQLAAALALLGAALPPTAEPAAPQQRRGQADRPKGPLDEHVEPEAPGIAWFGTWDGALAEAKRTGRPILFMSAAPQCSGVPGVW